MADWFSENVFRKGRNYSAWDIICLLRYHHIRIQGAWHYEKSGHGQAYTAPDKDLIFYGTDAQLFRLIPRQPTFARIEIWQDSFDNRLLCFKVNPRGEKPYRFTGWKEGD